MCLEIARRPDDLYKMCCACTNQRSLFYSTHNILFLTSFYLCVIAALVTANLNSVFGTFEAVNAFHPPFDRVVNVSVTLDLAAEQNIV